MYLSPVLALELLEGTWETNVGLLQFQGQSELLRQKDCSEFEAILSYREFQTSLD